MLSPKVLKCPLLSLSCSLYLPNSPAVYFILTPTSSPDSEVEDVVVWKLPSGPAETTHVGLVLLPTRVEALI